MFAIITFPVMKPDITIIIPVYNRAAIVERTLRSVEAQTWRPLRVVLVDNASTDDTLRVLEDWKSRVETPDFKVDILEETHPGAAAARNKGLAATDSKWTMFFDSDDVMLPRHVERAMKAAESHPEAEVIGWSRIINFLDGSSVRREFMTSDAIYNNIMHSTMSTLTYMARTEIFRLAGDWAEDVSMVDDVVLGHRILSKDPKLFKISGKPTVVVYESAASITNTSNLRQAVRAYYIIRDSLPDRQKPWIDFRCILYATTTGRNDPEAPAFIERQLAETPLPRRLLWRLLQKYTARGGRGAARIYRLFSH